MSRQVQNFSRIIRLPVYLQDALRQKDPDSDLNEYERAGLAVKNGLIFSLGPPLSGGDSIDVVDQQTRGPGELAEHSELLRLVREAVSSALDEREAYVISHRFGLKNGKTETYKTIGDDLGLSRERIRQIQAKALDKLRDLAPQLAQL